MQTLKKLKLTSLSAANLAEREMNRIRGGNNCGCGCNGSSSKADNYSDNWSGNKYSLGGSIICNWEGSGGVTVYGGSKAPGMP